MGDQAETEQKNFPKFDQALKGLSRIKCLEACVDSLNKDLTLPAAVGYLPKCFVLKTPSTTDLPLFRHPSVTSFKKCVRFSGRHIAYVSGNMEFNKDGIWVKLIKVTLDDKPFELEDAEKLWMLLYNFNNANTLFAFMVPYAATEEEKYVDDDVIVGSSWMDMAERCFLPFGIKDKKAEEFVSSSTSLAVPPSQSWSKEHDEQICQLLLKHSMEDTQESLIESLRVSSSEETKNGLFTHDPEDAWCPSEERDQYIEIKLKPGVYIEVLGLKLNRSRMGYISGPVVVTGGSPGNMETLFERPSDTSYSYPGDELVLLKKQKNFLKVIKISFVCTYAGEICISGLLIVPQKSEYACFNFYNSAALTAYPKLQNVPADVLCRRSMLLDRVKQLFDSCILLLYPSWSLKEQTGLNGKIAQHLHHILLISTLRTKLASIFLEKTEQEYSGGTIYLTINRRLVEDSNKRSTNPKDSIFYQIYSQVKPYYKPINFRFPQKQNQWWSCNFVNERVSDQGGGFRDSMTNIAEELCPAPGNDKEPVFNLFIQSPNQRNPDSHDGDSYIPNSSCKEFALYKWIGNLMGACFRTSETIAFSFPKFFWKMFLGYEVTWKDYSTVDQKEVTDLALMEKMDKVMFDDYFLDTRSWSHVVSNGALVELKKDGENMMLQFEDRLEYIRLVQEARLQEFKPQVDALREGFLEAIPLPVTYLRSVEEVEEMVCGRPTVGLDDLKKHVTFKFAPDKQQVQMFWDVMEKLSDEERSHFLKFASGRKRLPVFIAVNVDAELTDILPTAATCSSTFVLPKYSTFEKALTMIRYAINSCQTIDTD